MAAEEVLHGRLERRRGRNKRTTDHCIKGEVNISLTVTGQAPQSWTEKYCTSKYKTDEESICMRKQFSYTHASKTLQSVLHSAARLKMRKRFSLTLTASHRHSEMIFTGCQCLRGLSTNSASSSTGACIRLLRSTFKSCVCLSQLVPVTVTCAQLLVVTTSSDNKNYHFRALQRVLPNFGTVNHPHSEIRH